MKKLVVAAGVAILLASQISGCANMTYPWSEKVVEMQKMPAIDPQLASLNSVADQVSSQLDKLIRLERGLPESGIEQASSVSMLKTPVFVQWDGSGEDLVSGLSKKIGFRFIKTGQSPFTPIIVPVDGKSRSVEAVLRIVADRMGSSAEIKVSEKQKTIEVAYRKN
jgi:hypothetical protein